MTLLERLEGIAADITLGMACKVRVEDSERGPFVQIKCWRRDVITGMWDWGYGGKAYPDPDSTDSQLVQMIFGLFRAYWEHEVRENFEYQGLRVYGPHISVEALMSVAKRVDVRDAQHVEDRA